MLAFSSCSSQSCKTSSIGQNIQASSASAKQCIESACPVVGSWVLHHFAAVNAQFVGSSHCNGFPIIFLCRVIQTCKRQLSSFGLALGVSLGSLPQLLLLPFGPFSPGLSLIKTHTDTRHPPPLSLSLNLFVYIR